MFCWCISAFYVLVTSCGSFAAFVREQEQTKRQTTQKNCSIALPRGETLHRVPLILLMNNGTLSCLKKLENMDLFCSWKRCFKFLSIISGYFRLQGWLKKRYFTYLYKYLTIYIGIKDWGRSFFFIAMSL